MYIGLLLIAAALAADSLPPAELPKVLDARLSIELFAADPDIVTPTGIAVDARGRVLAVESHTHFPLEDYPLLKHDRIRMFEDTDGDGRADRISTFFEGTTWTMNVGVHPNGAVYIATRDEIFRLRDTDDDGRADERTPIARLETKGDYPHNGLSGFAFDFAGNVYFGFGENKGAPFKLIGADGSTASELEGGHVYCCGPDGSSLRMVAFGFWNPFHLAFDTFGRLFAVDNDPDSLPPCRLMHMVEGGNYGYRYRNGRKGVHPFTAWNGELPGTLPMVAGTGEAPSGLVAYESDHLPVDYVGDLLGTSWGDHRIERFHLEPRGASFQAVGVPIVKGDENFRPVGLAVAPDGSLFASDWMLKSYNVHGRGRIWHITTKGAKPSVRPHSAAEAIRSPHRPLREQAARQLAADALVGRPLLERLALADPSDRVRAASIEALGDVELAKKIARSGASPAIRALAIRTTPDFVDFIDLVSPREPAEVRAESLKHVPAPVRFRSRQNTLQPNGPVTERAALLWSHVSDGDAFLAQAAREGLARLSAVRVADVLARTKASDRLAGVLILRETRAEDGREALPRFLSDPDAAVRFAAIQWVGEERLTQFREPLVAAISAGPATARLFGGYLAALERLDGVQRESSDEWAGEQYIVRALDDSRTTSEVRRWALRMLRADHPALNVARLQGYLDSPDRLLQLEAVRTLRDSKHAERGAMLARLAADASRGIDLRAEAVVGLSGDDPRARPLLLALAIGGETALRDEALRSLRGTACSAEEQQQLRAVAKSDARTAELVARVVEPALRARRPAVDDVDGWLKLVDGSAGERAPDAAAGERIFFHPQAARCGGCHQVGGRGAKVGPELTAAAGKLDRARLVESIVRPGKEIAPQFATWQVVTTSGKTILGLLVHEEATGEQTYADEKGQLLRLAAGEVESRRVASKSIMPDGLGELLTVGELRDLLAFLGTQLAVER